METLFIVVSGIILIAGLILGVKLYIKGTKDAWWN